MYVHGICIYIQCIYMYIDCTWVPHIVCIYHCYIYMPLHTCLCSLLHRNELCNSTGIYHCVQRGIYLLSPKNGCWDNWLKHVCTLHIHVHTVSICVHMLYMDTRLWMYIPLQYMPLCTCLYWPVLSCTSFKQCYGTGIGCLVQSGFIHWCTP